MTTVTPATVSIPTVSGTVQEELDAVSVSVNSQEVVRTVQVIADAVNAGNYLGIDANGNAQVTIGIAPTSKYTRVKISKDFAANDTLELAPATEGKSNKLFRLVLFTSAPTGINILDGDAEGDSMSGTWPFLEVGSVVLDASSDPWFETTVGNALTIQSSQIATITGVAYYAQG